MSDYITLDAIANVNKHGNTKALNALRDLNVSNIHVTSPRELLEFNRLTNPVLPIIDPTTNVLHIRYQYSGEPLPNLRVSRLEIPNAQQCVTISGYADYITHIKIANASLFELRTTFPALKSAECTNVYADVQSLNEFPGAALTLRDSVIECTRDTPAVITNPKLQSMTIYNQAVVNLQITSRGLVELAVVACDKVMITGPPMLRLRIDGNFTGECTLNIESVLQLQLRNVKLECEQVIKSDFGMLVNVTPRLLRKCAGISAVMLYVSRTSISDVPVYIQTSDTTRVYDEIGFGENSVWAYSDRQIHVAPDHADKLWAIHACSGKLIL